jgi:hypothetical protein
VPLVREMTVNLSNLAETPILRDWHIPEAGPGAGMFYRYQRIGDQRFLVFYSKRAIRVAELEADGTVGIAAKVLETNFEDDNVIVMSKLVGTSWWVGGYSSRSNAPTTLHLRKIDPKTRSGIGDEIPIAWPLGHPGELVDANGTPMMLTTLVQNGAMRPALYPIDESTRAVCRPSTFTITKYQEQYQSIRAHHLVGDTMGMMLDSWANGARRMFFARAACRAQ